MDYLLRFAYAPILYILVPLVLVLMVIRYYYYRGVRYRYPLASYTIRTGLTSGHPRNAVLFFLRSILILLLTVLVAKPQLVDSLSRVTLEGIDIMLVIDVSGSMLHQHHHNDERSRIEIAKQEAIRFVDKRTNDAIGLVIFGNDALTRCPITADKAILKSIISDTTIGFLDPQGTMLSKGIIAAANRLKHSPAKSKVIVVLTDGQPSPGDSDPLVATAIAKELGIKIYTIGIGEESMPAWNGYPVAPTLNRQLLEALAKETGGMFFEAKHADDMRRIYDTIDTLEKNKIEAPIFSRTYDWFIPLVWAACACMFSEAFVSAWLWFGV